MTAPHVPVLVQAVVEAGEGSHRIVDGTVGDGGHLDSLLAATSADCLAIDRDPDALRVAQARVGNDRVSFLEGRFSDAVTLDTVRTFRPDFILLDLGVSSRQIDEEGRGFTFRPGAPLDMRMGQAGDSAAELLNTWSSEELARIFAEYADERHATRLAREILKRRATKPFHISDDLVNAIRAVRGPRAGPPDFARVFQAVRIAVNEELEGLEYALPLLRDALAPGGRMAIISYHSGEDRLVKRAFHEWSRECICPPRQPICTCRGRALGTATPRKPIVPSAAEIVANPRARSAKLRIFQVRDEG